MKKPPLIIIRRIRMTRFVGVSEAARQLGVSRQAVTNFANGAKGSISADKAARISIINER